MTRTLQEQNVISKLFPSLLLLWLQSFMLLWEKFSLFFLRCMDQPVSVFCCCSRLVRKIGKLKWTGNETESQTLYQRMQRRGKEKKERERASPRCRSCVVRKRPSNLGNKKSGFKLNFYGSHFSKKKKKKWERPWHEKTKVSLWIFPRVDDRVQLGLKWFVWLTKRKVESGYPNYNEHTVFVNVRKSRVPQRFERVSWERLKTERAMTTLIALA